MFKRIQSGWRWIVRLEEVYAVVTFIFAAVPVGVGVVLTAMAHQQGWIVWLVGISTFGFFMAGRYYFAKYRSEFGISGNINIGFTGLQIDGDVDEQSGECTKRLSALIRNTAAFPMAVSLKYKFHLDGRLIEDEDFDAPVFIGARSARVVTTDGLVRVSESANQWRCTITCRYGPSINSMKGQITLKCRADPPSGYIVEQFVDELI